ncbi:MAG: patatin-like phospholipase family protein [Bacteroidales bacterium]|nr:patatin-like phospholipase family protein [Bacteroidales bacterium]
MKKYDMLYRITLESRHQRLHAAALRFALAFALLLTGSSVRPGGTGGFTASAQSHAVLDSIMEAGDLRLTKIRAMMDDIRQKNNRPTVALVLSGGGAKGAAHVGVIRYLESIGMPVDVVLGTSMGGLVGGIYSLGYNASQLDSIVRGIDWDMALSDKVPRQYMSYSKIKYKEKYALSFPFYYTVDDYMKQKQDEMQYPHRSEDIHFGAEDGDATAMVKDNLLGSLPSGMVFGQNVSNIFSSLSVGYQDECDFYDLPIPFICVATDLVTGTAKIWTQGKINTALRSTMSIPGLFTPVKTDGMVLVDGGMRNNFPTDIAKKIGADIVIGVTLSTGYRSYSEINNLGDIIDTGIDMMGRASFESNVNIPDVTIRPDMHDYGMLSFDSQSIATIISRGYEAAVAMAPQLDSIKMLVGKDTTSLACAPAFDIRRSPVAISEVEIEGVSEDERTYLMSRLDVGQNSCVGSAEMEDAVATIYGTDAFDYVNYELLGSEEPFRLKFDCRKGPVNKVGLGARFDTEEVVAVLLNIGIGVQKLQGSSLDITGKVGANPFAGIVFSHCYPDGLTLNMATSFNYIDRNKFSMGDNRFRLNMSDLRAEMYLSNLKWSQFFLKAGLRADRFRIGSLMATQYIGDYDSEQLRNGFMSAFIEGRNDTFDNAYIPTTGKSIGMSYQFVFGANPYNTPDFHAFTFDAKTVFGGDALAAIPSLDVRCLVGPEVPAMYSNLLGGSMRGRYIDHQMAFYGIENVVSMKKNLAVAGLELRTKLFKNNYLSGIVNFATSADRLSSYKLVDEDVLNVWGLAMQYTYNTIVGPFRADLHWSNYSKSLGVFLSMGFDF